MRKKDALTSHVFSPDLYEDKRVDVEEETEERNIQQRSFHQRSEPSHVEFVDQHHPARPDDYVHGDSSD